MREDHPKCVWCERQSIHMRTLEKRKSGDIKVAVCAVHDAMIDRNQQIAALIKERHNRKTPPERKAIVEGLLRELGVM